MTTLSIHAQWSDDSKVWIATSEDVIGLCVQADSFEELVMISTDLVPDLLDLNHVVTQSPITLCFVTEYKKQLAAA